MLERSGPILRIICLGLAALLFVQFVRLVAGDPLKQVTIPAALSSPACPMFKRTERNGSALRQESGKPKRRITASTMKHGEPGMIGRRRAE